MHRGARPPILGQRSEQGWFFQEVFSVAFDNVLQNKKLLVRKELKGHFLSLLSLEETKTDLKSYKTTLGVLENITFKNSKIAFVTPKNTVNTNNNHHLYVTSWFSIVFLESRVS